jgi:hypothetical protein
MNRLQEVVEKLQHIKDTNERLVNSLDGSLPIIASIKTYVTSITNLLEKVELILQNEIKQVKN